jgi:hypothetical protein
LLEPEEDGFVYRTRRDPAGMDPAMRRMALGAGGVSLVVIVVALLWSGVRGAGFGPPPVITAPPGPLRIVPANPGGLVVPEANVPIMSGVTPVAPPQLAPGTPTPDISQLDQEAGIGAPPPAQPAPAGAGAPPQPVPNAEPAPAAVPAGPKTADSAPQPAAKPMAASGNVAVQLAATGSEAGAQAVWRGLQRKLPALLSHRSVDIFPAVVGGQTVWRLRVGGFASAEAARDFCASVRARGAACAVASF